MVQSKLDILRSNLEKLDAIPQASLEQFSADFKDIGAALYLLQTSIQALVDLASYLVARNALPTPHTSHDTTSSSVWSRRGFCRRGSALRFGPIVGFPKRVVHIYDRIDESRVCEILSSHLSDLAELLDLLLAAAEGDDKFSAKPWRPRPGNRLCRASEA